jgi:beta-lactamase regulating signal transducer with metallopeptidase domain
MNLYSILQGLLSAADPFSLAALAAKATLLLSVALVLSHLTRAASASVRHLIAAATFGVLLLMPLAAALVPPRMFTVARPAAAPPALRLEPSSARITDPARETVLPAGRALTVDKEDALAAAAAFYLTGVAWLGVSLLIGLWRLFRLGSRAEVSVAGTRLASEMARAERLPTGIEVAVSSRLAVPMTFGWTHPVILLPDTAGWDEPQLARAIRHELEHIARGDWTAHLVSRLALAVYWPHPFAWLLWRRLRLEAERACDDAVVRSQGAAEPYAEQLVSLARKLMGRAVPALSMATRSNLGLRVEAILDRGCRRAPRSRRASLSVGVAALAAMLAIAPFRVIGAPLPVAQAPVAAEDEDADDEDSDPLDEALLQAAERGALDRMRRLLDRGAHADAAIQGDGSPLIAAARRGQIEAMKMLIAAGANVNRGVRGDGSALIMAAREGHLDAVRLLLENGADIDLGVPGDGNALIMAAGEGRLDVVRFLLDRGASLEKVVPGDENPLIKASESGQAEAVRLLIARGANVNARVWAVRGSRDGGEWRTPLVMARRGGHQDVVRILLAAGATE